MSEKLKIEWGDGILSLPKNILPLLQTAGGFELKVLISIAAEDELRNDANALKAELCKRLDCTENAYNKALSFWKSNGLLTIPGSAPMSEAAPIAETTAPMPTATPAPETTPAPVSEPAPESAKPEAQPKKFIQSQLLPHYSESECADIIERSPEMPDTISMCQQLLGKIFTTADVEVIVGLCDHLGLGPDYVACLIKYCVDNGKKSMRYIEKTAVSLFDEGICTSEALNDYLKRKEKLNESIAQIQTMTGSVGRPLTPYEKKTFSCWLEEWKYDIDVITKAWEVTIGNINIPKVSYMNKVLLNWHDSGFQTLADVEAYCEAYKKKKEAMNAGQSVGFQTDEIMEAILKRSYGNG